MKISVVIFSYNFENYIANSIDSVLAQSLEPSEIICVDDYSTDRTYDIIEDYERKVPNIVGLRNRYSKEYHNSLNQLNLLKTALKYCSSEYIFLLDGDDFWSSNKLESFLGGIKLGFDFLFDTPIKILGDKKSKELLLVDYVDIDRARHCLSELEIPYFTTGQTSSLGFKTTFLMSMVENYRSDLSSVWLDIQLGRVAFFMSGISICHIRGMYTFRRIHGNSDSLKLVDSSNWHHFKNQYMELFGFKDWYTARKMLSLLSCSMVNFKLFIELIEWNVVTVSRKFL